jgi:UPF0176 protein
MEVAAFYRFAALGAAELQPLRRRLLAAGEAGSLKGTILLATEGVNGTVCGSPEGVHALLELLREDPRLAGLPIRSSCADGPVFDRFKVRIKREIVSLGEPCANPLERVGRYVEPRHWDALIRDPETLLIDTRNRFEVRMGSFPGALDPGTACFRDFPAWVERELRPRLEAGPSPRLALFCTGGIRCEKATSYLLARGFDGVHHLRGGILGYLEEIPPARSSWRGECFVFDQRVALDHHLAVGRPSLCPASGPGEDRPEPALLPERPA